LPITKETRTMPTKEQMESVTRRISELQSATYYFATIFDGEPYPDFGDEEPGYHRDYVASGGYDTRKEQAKEQERARTRIAIMTAAGALGNFGRPSERTHP
jgi:hypothetical protein